MGRHEDRHTPIARQVDQQFLKPVTRQGVDTRGRLVEDQHLGLVNDGDCQREPLPDAERRIEGTLVDIICSTEAVDQFGNTRSRLAHWQVKQTRVKIEVLPNRQFCVERE